MTTRERLLNRLADGNFHSGQALAAELGLTRAAVWKQIQRIEGDLGIAVDAVRGRGYRLGAPLELLDDNLVRQQLGRHASRSLESLQILSVATSTNVHALSDLPRRMNRARVWLAEHQTAGRGRRGRPWVSAFGRNVYLSVAWRFDLPMTDLAGLSLASGVVVAETLDSLGLRNHTLKWPNDVLHQGRKLAGILLEAAGEATGPAVAVVGVGVNFHVPNEQGQQIDQPWTDLRAAGIADLSRNRLAGLLIDGLVDAFAEFSARGLAPFLERWQRFDGLVGRRVCVMRGSQHNDGIYRGVAASGALLLEQDAGLREFHAGEVSLRGLDVA